MHFKNGRRIDIYRLHLSIPVTYFKLYRRISDSYFKKRNYQGKFQYIYILRFKFRKKNSISKYSMVNEK